MSQLFCIILAGGAGSRLWPVSREAFPKQLLKLDNKYTLFQRTFLNAANIVNDKNIITAVNVKYSSNIKEQLKELKEKFYRKTEYKIVTEPVSKDTTPAVTLGAKYIYDNLRYFSADSPLILVVPSDELFENIEIYANTVEKAQELARNGYIVVFGSETENVNANITCFKARKNSAVTSIEPSALKVSRFIDSPTETSPDVLQKGKTYVNTGIYMFSFDTYMAELKKNEKEIYSLFINKQINDSIPSIDLNEYENLNEVSLEEGIISHSKKLALLPLETKWQDIGSWDAVYDICEKDENGNCFSGKVVDMDSENTLIYSTDKLVATLGLKDMIVVSTEDASFICDKNNPDDIKKIYENLNDKNSATREIHKTVFRPWGYYTVLENGDGFLTKCITVNPQAKLSLQKHFHRSEHWIVLEGEAVVIKGNDKIILKSGESIDIAIEEIHSLQNTGSEQLKILEVQSGDILDENDIERIEDIYGRV